jgi:hypothetical protein
MPSMSIRAAANYEISRWPEQNWAPEQRQCRRTDRGTSRGDDNIGTGLLSPCLTLSNARRVINLDMAVRAEATLLLPGIKDLRRRYKSRGTAGKFGDYILCVFCLWRASLRQRRLWALALNSHLNPDQIAFLSSTAILWIETIRCITSTAWAAEVAEGIGITSRTTVPKEAKRTDLDHKAQTRKAPFQRTAISTR